MNPQNSPLDPAIAAELRALQLHLAAEVGLALMLNLLFVLAVLIVGLFVFKLPRVACAVCLPFALGMALLPSFVSLFTGPAIALLAVYGIFRLRPALVQSA